MAKSRSLTTFFFKTNCGETNFQEIHTMKPLSKISALSIVPITATLHSYASALNPDSPRKIRSSTSQLKKSRSLETLDEDPPAPSPTTCKEYEIDFKFDMLADDFGGIDNYWTLIDKANGGTVALGRVTGNNTLYDFQQCLPKCGTYEFNLYDNFGDGITFLEAGTESWANVTVDNEKVFDVPNGNDGAFFVKSVAFDGNCTDDLSSRRIVVNEETLDEKHCVQPKNVWDNEFTIVAKPCVPGKKVQEWNVDYMGQWHSAWNEDYCITRNGGLLVLAETCSDDFVKDSYPTNFMYNIFERTIQLYSDNSKALTLNKRNMKLHIRDYASPGENRRKRQDFTVETVYRDHLVPNYPTA
jgi:hypothetical protein